MKQTGSFPKAQSLFITFINGCQARRLTTALREHNGRHFATQGELPREQMGVNFKLGGGAEQQTSS